MSTVPAEELAEQAAQIKQHENTIDLLQNVLFEFRKGKDAHEAISDLIEKYEDRIAGLQACIRIRDVRNGELVVQIEALKEKLVEERARRICHVPTDSVGHWSRYEDIVVAEARQQLAEDPDLNKAGVEWE